MFRLGMFVLVLAVALGGLGKLAVDDATDFSHLPEPLRPFRPPGLLMANYLLGKLPSLLPSLQAGDMMGWAEYTTGLSDWDDPDGKFVQALQVLSESFAQECKFTPIGQWLTRLQMHAILENRLKIARYAKRNARVENENITKPVFIIGLPRSGTSFLHNLLKYDTENFRAYRLWEIQDPVPPTDPENPDEAYWRIFWMRLQLTFFTYLAPSVAAVHNLHELNAEECMPTLALDARSLLFNTLYTVPSYQLWLMEQDPRHAFRYHKKFMQTLQAGEPETRPTRKTWLLKTPWHMFHLDEIWQVYPDAVVIMPHRSLHGVVASLSSLHARFYGIVTDEIHPKAIGEFQLNQWKRIIPRYLKAREDNKDREGQIIDLQFQDLVKHPLDTVKRVYHRFGWSLSSEAEARMMEYLQGSKGDGTGKRGQHGKHEYHPEWFGLSNETVAQCEEFQQYSKVYALDLDYKHSDDY